MPLQSAVWFTTMHCNFNCPYCWEVQAQRLGDFKPEKWGPSADPWVAAWNRLKPQILDITGGEPLMIPWIVDFFKRLDPSIKLGLTSNLSFDLSQFVQKVPPDRFVNWTCSFHPSDNGTAKNPMNPDLFMGKVLLLKNRGYPVCVNFVAWPEQLWLIPKWKAEFEALNVRFHVDPYGSHNYFPFVYTHKEIEFIRKFTGQDRAPHPWAVEHGENYRVKCNGGRVHLSVQPDGTAWRCILDRQKQLNPLGNILDADFGLLEAERTCDFHWQCPGCDRDKVAVKFVGKTDPAPPLVQLQP